MKRHPLIPLAAATLAAILGCWQSPYHTALRNENGEVILLSDISSIINDDSLTDEEKREQLINLGITDEKLLDVFVPPE